MIEAQPLAEQSIPPLVAFNPDVSPWVQSEFLSSVVGMGASASSQGVWVQSETQAYASYQAQKPLSAASVTKLGTTLAALDQLSPGFRFKTKVGYRGKITGQTLDGDLVVLGGDDPFFVWEDAFSVANVIESLGIKTITGSLIFQSPFTMNFESEPATSGLLFKQGLNSNLWPEEAIAQFNTLPPGTPKPTLEIRGNSQFVTQVPSGTTWIVQHQSLPLIELLKRMNRYSNNPMADQIANYLGGGENVTRIVQSLTGLKNNDVRFINGSGLGPENQITPQGATLMIQSLSNLLKSQNMSLGDVMTIVGQDEGILDPRPLPPGLVVKSGTLNQVSALAGVLPTQSEGPIWFTIFNTQGDVAQFRALQEALLGRMSTTWKIQPNEPLLTPTLDPSKLASITERL